MNKIRLITIMTAFILVLSSCAQSKSLISGSIDVSSSFSKNSSASDESSLEDDKILEEIPSDNTDESSLTEISSEKENSSSKNESKEESKAEQSSKPKAEESSKAEKEDKKPQENSSESKSENSSASAPEKKPDKNRKPIELDRSENDKELLPEEVSSNSSQNIIVSDEVSDVPDDKPDNKNKNETETPTVSSQDEMRAIWISYLDFYSLLQEKSENEFRRNIKSAFAKIADMELNTVIVQVRPYSDALYYSDIFPMSYVVNGENQEGMDPGFDPLKIMVDYAHDYGLKIEAWINPYRIRGSGSKSEISKDNPAYKWIQNGDDAVLKHSGGYSYNPASKKAQSLIIEGVEEIVRNYDVDGIHFDDYFYPTTDMSIDKKSYNDYLKNGGNLSQDNFRRKNVDDLVRGVYRAIKNIDPSVSFGISPQGNDNRNYNQQYIDVNLWLSQKGYVDYICPQIYFGFNNSDCPFENTVKLWNNKIKAPGVKLYIGIASYKIGLEDKWAGEGKNEWLSNSDMMKRMVKASRKYSNYRGFFLYRYDSLFNPAPGVKNRVSTEIDNLKSVL